MPLPATDKPQASDSWGSSTALVKMLSRAEAYPERTSRVEVVETHISWVFLTDRRVYKLKKPVKFEFLDFSTPELRRQACEKEVALNQRLAHDTYLGVVPMTVSRGRPRVAGKGTPVDWLVRMRRLPRDRSLDQLMLRESLTDADLTQIALTLEDFYRTLPPVSLPSDQYRQQIETHVRANCHALLNTTYNLDASLVRRIHASQLRTLRLNPEVFDNRVRDGRIVDGHGDLRPEHIYLIRPTTIIDCIEFNAEFRRLDVLDELSFLSMECALLGDRSVGGRILQHYCQASGDLPAPGLLPFYSSYRACVRAKVHALRSGQLGHAERVRSIDTATSYLQLADQYAAEIGPPLMIVVHGISGSGKSTLSAALAESLGMDHLSTDAERRRMFGASTGPAAFDERNYHPQKRQQVYERLFELAGTLLGQRNSVILDGTFLTRKRRAQAASLARRHGAVAAFVRCRCREDVAARRVAQRDDSDAESRPEFVSRQREQQEADQAGLESCDVEMTTSLPAMLNQVFDRLKSALAC